VKKEGWLAECGVCACLCSCVWVHSCGCRLALRRSYSCCSGGCGACIATVQRRHVIGLWSMQHLCWCMCAISKKACSGAVGASLLLLQASGSSGQQHACCGLWMPPHRCFGAWDKACVWLRGQLCQQQKQPQQQVVGVVTVAVELCCAVSKCELTTSRLVMQDIDYIQMFIYSCWMH
jgi:hypothetical protein